MRFELVKLVVTKGSKDVKEGSYWAIKDNEEIEDYNNYKETYDLSEYQPYGIIIGETDMYELYRLIDKAEEEDCVGYLTDEDNIICWEFMNEIECYEKVKED